MSYKVTTDQDWMDSLPGKPMSLPPFRIIMSYSKQTFQNNQQEEFGSSLVWGLLTKVVSL